MSAAAAREYAAARETAAWARLDGRGLLKVTGPQRVKFLHDILSNDLLSRRPGQGVAAALLDVKGHLLALMRALVTDDAVLLEIPEARLEVVEGQLAHYRVGAPVRFAREALTALGVLGPAARDVLGRAGATLPDAMAREDHIAASLGGAEARLVRAGDLPAEGWAVQARPEDAETVRRALEAAGAVAVGPDTLDVLRIEDGRPWYGRDVGEENLLHETGLLGEYHSPSKGCYVGQEVIARLEARGGHVNKLVRGLRLSGPVRSGLPVHVDGREVGRVTTAGVSPRLGAVALAVVHRSANEPGTAVSVEGVPGTVERLPLARST